MGEQRYFQFLRCLSVETWTRETVRTSLKAFQKLILRKKMGFACAARCLIIRFCKWKLFCLGFAENLGEVG